MFKKLFYTGLLLVAGWVASAQPALRSVNPDSLTWQLYQQQQWIELLKTGKQLNRQGIDYYYLRMRLAVAALETHRYDDAVAHLHQALNFNPRDLQARRMLVLARRYSLMPAEAGKVFAGLPENQQSDLGIKPGFKLIALHADAGISKTNLSIPDNFSTLAGEAGYYGSQSGLKESGLLDVGAWMQLRPGWLLYGGFQSMGYDFAQNFAYLEPEMKLDRVEINGTFKDFYYNIVPKPIVFDARIYTLQRTFYIQSRYALTDNLQFVASAGISKLNGEYPYLLTDSIRFIDTARLDLNTGLATLFSVDVPAAKASTLLWRTTDFRLVLGGIAHFGRISPAAGVHFGRVNDTNIVQLQAGYTWRLMGNAKTWQQTELFLLGNDKQLRPALKLAAGYWFGTSTQLSASLLAGHLNGMADHAGYVVFNHRDKIDLFGEGVIIQKITPVIYFSFRYRYGRSRMKNEQLDENLQLKVSYNDLISHGLIGGLIWNL